MWYVILYYHMRCQSFTLKLSRQSHLTPKVANFAPFKKGYSWRNIFDIFQSVINRCVEQLAEKSLISYLYVKGLSYLPW